MIALAELAPECSYPTTIGNEYGDIYEHQYETARKSRLNTGKVPDLVHSHIKPTMAANPLRAKL